VQTDADIFPSRHKDVAVAALQGETSGFSDRAVHLGCLFPEALASRTPGKIWRVSQSIPEPLARSIRETRIRCGIAAGGSCCNDQFCLITNEHADKPGLIAMNKKTE